MHKRSAVSTFFLAVVVSLTVAGSLFFASDAAAQGQKPPSAIHGFFDTSLKNDYVTPRGLFVTEKNSTIQVLSGLVFSLYDDKTAPVSSVSLVGGVWNDIAVNQHNRNVGDWNEFDWFIGVNTKVAQSWKLGVTYIQFLSPPGNFKAESNIEFTLAYDDSAWGLPVTINPYVKPFWAVFGDSTVVTGKRGGTFDVEIGMTPTLDLTKYKLPVILSAPTWVTVGPTEYWGGGSGALRCTGCKASNLGVWSTGLQAKVPLAFVPSQFGNWYVRGGAQYYHVINDNLLYAQNFTLGLPVTTKGAPSKKAHEDIGLVYGAIGFDF